MKPECCLLCFKIIFFNKSVAFCKNLRSSRYSQVHLLYFVNFNLQPSYAFCQPTIKKVDKRSNVKLLHKCENNDMSPNISQNLSQNLGNLHTKNFGNLSQKKISGQNVIRSLFSSL